MITYTYLVKMVETKIYHSYTSTKQLNVGGEYSIGKGFFKVIQADFTTL